MKKFLEINCIFCIYRKQQWRISREDNRKSKGQSVSTSETTSPQRLTRPPKIHMLQQILHQDCWLTSDTTDLASYLLAKNNLHIDGFQSVLPFSAIENGGIVGTPQNKFVQILNIWHCHWITVSNLFIFLSWQSACCVWQQMCPSLDPDTVLLRK